MTTSTTQTPVLSPSSIVYVPQVSSSRRSPIINPLVMAGLVPEDLSDILSNPPNDSAVTKKRTMHITGARNLTTEEYVEMLREDKRKRIDVEEMMEKRKHEREKRKREIEKKKKEIRHRSQLPARFLEDIDDADGVLCEVFHSTETEGLASGTVFWIDCDKCGVWVHNFFFQKNDVSRKYVCSDCSANGIELFINDVLVCVFMHFNCLRSCVDAIIPVPEFF